MYLQSIEAKFYRHCSIIVRIIKMLLSIIILVIGGFIYIAYRNLSLPMFGWIDSLGLYDEILIVREFANREVYDWIKYSLPDGLWLLSYLLIIDTIWNGAKNKTSLLFILLLPFVSLLSELLQYFKLFPGVFDWVDMCAYFMAILLFVLLKIK